jgi:hemolysin activation/secretion protein
LTHPAYGGKKKQPDEAQAGSGASAKSGGDAPAGASSATPQAPKSGKLQRFDIDEYRVEGADTLPQIEVEEAVYPFLGPRRTPEDVEKARAALEKTYHDKGFQAVTVAIPEQDPRNGIVILKVTENRIGRTRVMGARYFEPSQIKKKAPSLAEGTVPNFNSVTKDIVALNQWPDRRVTPALRAGATPGTVDVDLNVEDKLPVHASAEFNNRQSPSTTPLRQSVTFSYANLWQLGHSLSFTYHVSPEDPSNVEVFSGSYLARLPENDFTSLLLYGLKSESNVATVGGLTVVGPGQIAGARAIFTLPARENFYHTASVGLDYKSFGQVVLTSAGDITFSTPVTYYPLVANYTATWVSESSLMQLNAGVTAGFRGIGSSPAAFDAKRFGATENFIHFNGDFSRLQTLPIGLQIYGRVQGQVTNQPLVSSEQFPLGGLDTVRGYLESEVLGDNGFAASVELRSPNINEAIGSWVKDNAGEPSVPNLFNEWRIFGFVDGGGAYVLEPLPEQLSRFYLWSYGTGARVKLTDYFNGMVVFAVPMISQVYTKARDPRVLFRIWGEF